MHGRDVGQEHVQDHELVQVLVRVLGHAQDLEHGPERGQALVLERVLGLVHVLELDIEQVRVREQGYEHGVVHGRVLVLVLVQVQICTRPCTRSST